VQPVFAGGKFKENVEVACQGIVVHVGGADVDATYPTMRRAPLSSASLLRPAYHPPHI